ISSSASIGVGGLLFTVPKCDKKKKDVIQHLAQKYNLVPKPVQQHTCANTFDQIKNAVHKFYLRDDVSYQLPDKRGTIVVKNDDNTKITYHKRILLNNLRESFELFIEENKGIIISRSSITDLRPPFVVPKAALAHRISNTESN
ncbi:unnamed protein product, partial [Didymodactylos carnosus]